MDRLMRSLIITLALMVPFTGNAATVVLDFATAVPVDSSGGSSEIRTLTYEIGGNRVTFSGYELFVSSCCFGTMSLTTQGMGRYPITVSFSRPVKWVEFTNAVSGVFTSEIDIIHGNAYDKQGRVIDSLSTGSTIHRLNGPRIFSLHYEGLDGLTVARFTFSPARGGSD